MIISELQITLLITKVHQLRANLLAAASDGVLTKAGEKNLEECNALLSSIANQQSKKLIDIGSEPFDPKDYE